MQHILRDFNDFVNYTSHLSAKSPIIIFINNKDPMPDNCGPGTLYSCDCDPGQFELDIGCVDYNECSASSDNCDTIGGTCSNLEPYYECICSDGSKVNPVTDPNATCGPSGIF